MKTEQWQWSANAGWTPGSLPETADLGTSAQIVLLFGSVLAIEAGRCFDLARRAYPNAHLFGCTTGGEIHSRYITDSTVTITAFSRAEQLRIAIENEPVTLKTREIHVTASLGVSWTNAGASYSDQLVQEADAALYQAKQAGRNRVEMVNMYRPDKAVASTEETPDFSTLVAS